MTREWWQKTNIYQVYIRSFFDTNADGIGDILGITAKLDYLLSLSVGAIWISPHYDSPMDDNGYDIRDFYRISSDYGTLSDFQNLIQQAHVRKIKIITDLVLNHTSDEHPWFLAAKDPTHPLHTKYHDYYIWHEPRYDATGKRMAPTRWLSWFGSSVWEYNPLTDEYYLHIFSRKMPDLNWRNPEMRAELKQMINWWLDLGIDGFRVDASNHLEKDWDFPDDFPGYQHFSSLPKHHQYLQELGREIFVSRNVLTIGESGGASQKEALMYCGYGSNEFNMLIQFGHCWADIDNHNPKLMGKWAQGKLEVHIIKESFQRWYEMLEGKGWNIIYWHNHDQPRVVSHYGNDSEVYRDLSAKMLALALYLMPGTAICYQGEEIGMTNVLYDDISCFRDVEVFTEYRNMLCKGFTEKQALAIIKARSRDNARTPMQWDASANGGFSKHEPWIETNPNYPIINVAKQDDDPDSVLNLYRTLLKMRVEDPNIADGSIEFIDIASDETYAYINSGATRDHLVLCNFTDHEAFVDLPECFLEGFELVLKNTAETPAFSSRFRLGPYHGLLYRREH